MKKIVLLIPALTAFLFFNCHDNEKEEEKIEPVPCVPQSYESDHVFSEACLFENTETDTLGFHLRLYLLNEKEEETTTFKEEENFTICLSIFNNSDISVEQPVHSEFLDMGFIYDSTCKMIGYADGLKNKFSVDVHTSIHPASSSVIGVPWSEKYNIRGTNCQETTIEGQNPLAKGNYHINFKHTFNLGDFNNANKVLVEIPFLLHFTVE